jgi:hypothetical protein
MNIFSKRKAKHILALGFLLVILLFVSFGGISLREVHTVGNLTKMIYEHPLVVSNAALNAGINMTKMHRGMKDVTLSNSPDEFDKAVTSLNKYEKLVYDELDVIRELIIGEEGQNLEKRTRHLFIAWKPIREEVFSLFHSGRRNEAALITKSRGADHVALLESKMLELTSYARKKADSFMHLADQSQTRVENISTLLVLAGVFLSAFIAFFTVRHVLKIEKTLLRERNELQKAISEIKTLSGLLPICASCKKIRDDSGYWNQIEAYIRDRSEAEFSHSICPKCASRLYPELVINEQNAKEG